MEVDVAPSLPADDESMLLVAQAKQGDQEALGQLLKQHEAWLQRIARVKLGSAMRQCLDSIDIVQDTFVVAVERLSAANAGTSSGIRTWLAGVVENVVRDKVDYHLAGKRDLRLKQGLHMGPSDGSAQEADPPADTTQPDEKASKVELQELLDDAVSKLPEPYREVIVLRDYIRAEWDEIQRSLGRETVGAVKQLHQRARIKLREIAMPRFIS